VGTPNTNLVTVAAAAVAGTVKQSDPLLDQSHLLLHLALGGLLARWAPNPALGRLGARWPPPLPLQSSPPKQRKSGTDSVLGYLSIYLS